MAEEIIYSMTHGPEKERKRPKGKIRIHRADSHSKGGALPPGKLPVNPVPASLSASFVSRRLNKLIIITSANPEPLSSNYCTKKKTEMLLGERGPQPSSPVYYTTVGNTHVFVLLSPCSAPKGWIVQRS